LEWYLYQSINNQSTLESQCCWIGW